MPHTQTSVQADHVLGRKALVLIPGTVNYFYNLAGRRVAESLRELGFEVCLATLGEQSCTQYDWCLLSNISEVLHSFGDRNRALGKLRELGRTCKVMTALSIDSVATVWYRRTQDDCRAAGVPNILDLSLHDQGRLLPAAARSTYRFLPAGLTTTELRSLDGINWDDAARTIPWAFVGHFTPQRIALVDYLIREVDPRGFVYMPTCAPYTEKGSPHLNQQQFETVLQRVKYQIWSSHHSAFYMEGERFRMSLLAGGVPVKVLTAPLDARQLAPFSYLMVQQTELADRLQHFNFQDVRNRFREEFTRIKPLAMGLAEFLNSVGILGAGKAVDLTCSRGNLPKAA
jgi:hypothetical protein